MQYTVKREVTITWLYFSPGVDPNLLSFAWGHQLFIKLQLQPCLQMVPSSTLVQRWLSGSVPDGAPFSLTMLIIILALCHGVYLFIWQTLAARFWSLTSLTEEEVPLCVKLINTSVDLTGLGEGVWEVCERCVTDGINHHGDGVRGLNVGVEQWLMEWSVAGGKERMRKCDW